jgi:hypothetical protein
VNIASRKKKTKSFFEMTGAEREEVAKEFDRESLLEESRPLSPKGKALWDLAKRRRGRPRLGTGAVKVLVTFDPALLDRVDAYAKDVNLKRSQLIARALEKEIKR